MFERVDVGLLAFRLAPRILASCGVCGTCARLSIMKEMNGCCSSTWVSLASRLVSLARVVTSVRKVRLCFA
jgi:hypothetical protein